MLSQFVPHRAVREPLVQAALYNRYGLQPRGDGKHQRLYNGSIPARHRRLSHLKLRMSSSQRLYNGSITAIWRLSHLKPRISSSQVRVSTLVTDECTSTMPPSGFT